MQPNSGTPIGPCLRCGGYTWWRTNLIDGPDAPSPWRCAACQKPPADGWLDLTVACLPASTARALFREAAAAYLKRTL